MNEAMIRFLLLGLLGLAAVLGQEQGGRNGIEGLDTRALHERGMEHFFAGRIEDSIKDWDREIELIPRRAPYHWQRGLALYYAGEFEKGVTQFVSHQKENGNDVENAVWHFL